MRHISDGHEIRPRGGLLLVLQKTLQAAENCYDDIFTRRNQLPQGHGGEDEQGTHVIQAVQQDVKSKFRTTAKVVIVVHRFDGGTKRLSAAHRL